MIYSGMIFQFNEAEGSGLIMSSSGESSPFSKHNWVENESEPVVGLKVCFEKQGELINIRLFSEEAMQAVTESKVQEKAADERPCFESVDEYLSHYQDEGYKLVRDSSSDGMRTAILRRFLEDGHGEVIIESKDDAITLTLFKNGKEI